LQAAIKACAPLEVGKGPISIFPSYEIETRAKELIEIYGPSIALALSAYD
jgi:hypothetical protein